jgi:hypothetical protein
MAKEIVSPEVSELLKAAGGSYIEAYRLLVKRREEAVVKAERSTVASRVLEKRHAIEELDADRLLELQQKLSAIVDTITKNELSLTSDGLLTEAEKHSLMLEFLEERDIKELIEARKDMLRELVFSHLTAEFEAQGVENPEHQNGEILVPELGHRFVRERCGRNDAVLNEEKLEALLGDQWESVCDIETIPAQYIPAHTKYVLREEKVLELAQKDESVLGKLLDCLEVGGWKNPTFTVRPLRER